MVDKKSHKFYVLDAILFIVFWMILWWWIMVWKQNTLLNTLIQNKESKYSKFLAIDGILEREFYDQELLNNSSEEMVEWALIWYVWAINDPYTVYLKEDLNTDLDNELKNVAWFAWIWAVIEKQDSYVLISEVLKWSPAAKAWLLPLDKIYMIEDKTVKDLTTNEILELIRWEKWTDVNLFIVREKKGWDEYDKFWVPVTRDEINIPSVKSEIIEKDWKKLLYLEISIMSSHTTSLLLDEFKESLNSAWKIDGIILDLRGNTWGYLEEAVKLLWHFFPKGTVLVKSKYQAYEGIEHISEWRWELWKYPIVILVDQLTASAWEIITLKFQESGKTIIWMKTFGKWSIQTVQDFTDWSSLKYTVWRRYSPNDVSIDKEWITPNIEIEWDYEKFKEDWTDNQLEAAKEELIKEIK